MRALYLLSILCGLIIGCSNPAGQSEENGAITGPHPEFSMSVSSPAEAEAIHFIIEIALPLAGHLTVDVYSATGYFMKNVFDGYVEAGVSSIVWEGINSSGETVNDGLYIIEAKSGVYIARMVISIRRS
jgi:hypothetical protein